MSVAQHLHTSKGAGNLTCVPRHRAPSRDPGKVKRPGVKRPRVKGRTMIARFSGSWIRDVNKDFDPPGTLPPGNKKIAFDPPGTRLNPPGTHSLSISSSFGTLLVYFSGL